MSADLDTWLAGERHRRWSLVTHDDGTIDAFEDLARRTEPHVGEDVFLPKWNPYSAFTPSSDAFLLSRLPDDLSAGWRLYGTRWSMFMAKNPRVWLCWLLGHISESDDSSSWPYAYSHRIRKWVQSGYTTDRPFNDRDGVDDAEMRDHLSRMTQLGWVVWDEAEHRFVWID